MTRLFRCLPYGNLPYTDIKAATKMMVKLFENIPYLPDFPCVNSEESILSRTMVNIPGVIFKDNKYIFNKGTPQLHQQLKDLDSAFNNPTEDNIEPYTFNTFFLAKYFQIIERVQPKYAVINFMGPFSLLQKISTKDSSNVLNDKFCRKSVVQTISIKAIWILMILNLISPETKPIIMLEEPLLCKLGSLKRENEDITPELVTNLFSKIIDKLHSYGALVGIQSFEKCDWNLPIDANADIISFDAFNNPNNLAIIAEKINDFLARGGRINWALIPVKNENMVKNLNSDFIYGKFEKTIECLITAGVSERLAYNRATISLLGDLGHLPIIFAEKALIMANQVAKKIPIKS